MVLTVSEAKNQTISISIENWMTYILSFCLKLYIFFIMSASCFFFISSTESRIVLSTTLSLAREGTKYEIRILHFNI